MTTEEAQHRREASSLLCRVMVLLGIRPVTFGRLSFDFHNGQVASVEEVRRKRYPLADEKATAQNT